MSFVHNLTGEHNPFRRFTLFIFARFIEVPLLKLCFHILRGKYRRFGKMRWVHFLAGFLLARPFGYLGDTAKPMPYNEVLSLIDTLDGPIAVGACRCRIGHKSCSHPLETDIVIRTGYEAWMKAFPSAIFFFFSRLVFAKVLPPGAPIPRPTRPAASRGNPRCLAAFGTADDTMHPRLGRRC